MRAIILIVIAHFWVKNKLIGPLNIKRGAVWLLSYLVVMSLEGFFDIPVYAEAYGQLVDMMDKADALPKSQQAQQQQDGMTNRILAA